MTSDRGPLRLCLFGGPLDSGNRGVEALGRSVLDAIRGSGRCRELTVFDNGWGVRDSGIPIDGGGTVALCGVRRSRRFYRPESWSMIRASQRLGLPNPTADRIRHSDAVLDLSGGDSFADVYGPTRLRTVMEPKLAALRARRPLVLLPQTFGPYTSPTSRQAVAQVLRRSTLAWARDDDSYAVIADLLGDDLDPSRHRRGVDVAFALRPADPQEALPTEVRAALENKHRVPVAGVNVSGLLANEQRAAERFGLVQDYLEVARTVVESLTSSGAVVLLIPHVRDRRGAGETDALAAGALLARLSPGARASTLVVPDTLDAAQLKWVISRCSWFTGARMHATIAALSSGVAVAGVAYSVKMAGVFRTCGMEDQVLDARRVGTAAGAEWLLDSWTRREEVTRRLQQNSPLVVQAATQQLDHTLTRIAGADAEEWSL